MIPDWETERRKMVEQQLRRRDIRDPRVLEWGIPVHVAIPIDPLHPGQPVKLRPGELVDLFFRPNESIVGAGIALK